MASPCQMKCGELRQNSWKRGPSPTDRLAGDPCAVVVIPVCLDKETGGSDLSRQNGCIPPFCAGQLGISQRPPRFSENWRDARFGLCRCSNNEATFLIDERSVQSTIGRSPDDDGRKRETSVATPESPFGLRIMGGPERHPAFSYLCTELTPALRLGDQDVATCSPFRHAERSGFGHHDRFIITPWGG